MEVINVESDSDAASIVEVQVPPKKSPPVIDLVTEGELMLNVQVPHVLMSKKLPPVQEQIKEIETVTREVLTPKKHLASEEEISLLKLISPPHWTVSMMKFYNNDWGGEEEFSVERIQARMNKNPSHWAISDRDRCGRAKMSKKIRCFNCQQFGHTAYRCPEPEHVEKCCMCGLPGHSDRICPEAKCLNCGEKTYEYTSSCYKCQNSRMVVCQSCCLLGHSSMNCTNIWRKYHLTLPGNKIKIPDINCHKDPGEFWCCNCAGQGHLSFECPYVSGSCYPETSPFVGSYGTMFASEVKYAQQEDPLQRQNHFVPQDKIQIVIDNTGTYAGEKRPRPLRYFDLVPNQQPVQLELPKFDSGKGQNGKKKKKRNPPKRPYDRERNFERIEHDRRGRSTETYEMWYSYHDKNNRVSHFNNNRANRNNDGPRHSSNRRFKKKKKHNGEGEGVFKSVMKFKIGKRKHMRFLHQLLRDQ